MQVRDRYGGRARVAQTSCVTNFNGNRFAHRRRQDVPSLRCANFRILRCPLKGRAHGAGVAAASAHCALTESLSVIQRLFAPFLPFAAEESRSWWKEASVHRAPWPDAFLLDLLAGPVVINDTTNVVSDVLREIRRAKSDAKASTKAIVDHVIVSDSAERLAILRSVERDLCDAGQVQAVRNGLRGEFWRQCHARLGSTSRR